MTAFTTLLLLSSLVSAIVHAFTMESFVNMPLKTPPVTGSNSNKWPEFLLEFRGLSAPFRWNEFHDSAQREGVQLLPEACYPIVVTDYRSQNPICITVSLPDADTAQRIASKCASVRRVLSIWGEGRTTDDLCDNLKANQASYTNQIDRSLSWRVMFDRYGREGRSGIDTEQKRAVLAKVVPALGDMGDVVNIKKADLDLLLLEDCSTYQKELNDLVAHHKAKRDANGVTYTSTNKADNTDNVDNIQVDAHLADELHYVPLRYLFGRVVAEGPSIVNDFALSKRPFVGTTSMNALCSHLSANAAQVRPGQRVLDPFCGTGSLLLAAAYLGANVVGTDIEGGGLMTPLTKQAAIELKSKNSNFRRKDGRSQHGRCVLDNFKHYRLQERVLDLFGASADRWLTSSGGNQTDPQGSVDQRINRYDKFDAIITDPPFGRREKATPPLFSPTSAPPLPPSLPLGHADVTAAAAVAGTAPGEGRTESPILFAGEDLIGNPRNAAVLVTLLQIARQRLVPGGRLVFWLPTKPDVDENTVESFLQELIAQSQSAQYVSTGAPKQATAAENAEECVRDSCCKLIFQRTTCETLNDSLWRWLCVLQLAPCS